MTTPNIYRESHDVVFEKPAMRRLSPKVIEGNITSLVTSTNTKSLKVQGWEIETAYVAQNGSAAWEMIETPGGDSNYVYTFYLRVTYVNANGVAPNKAMLSGILRIMDTRAPQPAFGKWELRTVNGEEYEVAEDENVTGNAADMLGYVDVQVPPDFDEYFGHLFGLEYHISRVRKALEAAVSSDWMNRYHCALIGPPGCGKTDICKSLKRMFGEDAVFEFDGTSTTAAGAIKTLSEAEILPRLIVIEEIEKAPEASMQFLLGILDLRSEIRKTTARATIQRDTKLFAVATVNDYGLFRKLQAGALHSRFMNKIHFNRPSRETLSLILTREIQKVNGNTAWIAPALDYCDEHGINDPREVIAIALCGADDLLTGEYQKMLAATAAPARA